MLFCLFHMQESGSSSNQRSQSSAQPNKSGAKPGYSPSYWNPNWTEQGRFGGWGEYLQVLCELFTIKQCKVFHTLCKSNIDD